MAAPLSPLFILPNENTDAGAMARLFINEAAGPHAKADLTVQAMGWMRCVLQNRLKYPGKFGAPGATTITQIITAHVRAIQFAGFDSYPAIQPSMNANIQAKLAIASDKTDRRQAIYLNFVKAAIAAATGPAPVDPCATGLYFWRTAQASGPGGKAVYYQTLDGNDFYSLPADFFGRHKR
jgi:hypothetical protein